MKKQIQYTTILLALVLLPVPVFALDFGAAAGNALGNVGLGIFAMVGLLFQTAIEFLVFGIGAHMSGQLGFVINTVWTIVRDLCNLVFIFIFLFLGIKLVLTIESPEGARKTLVPLLIAALLVNFSLFFAKAIIDLANVAAVAVYGLFSMDGNNVDIAASIAGSLGLASWFRDVKPDELGNMNFTNGIMMMIFFLVAAMAFLTATVVLLKRYVVLLLGMIISPLVLLFRLVPNVPFLSSVAKKTQEGFSMFISSAFFPAVFLFLIYVSIKIVGSYANKPEFSEGIMNAGSGKFGTIIVYCIGIALLFVALKSASMISDTAASMSMSMSRKAAGAATAGTAAFLGRQTLGRFGKLTQDKLADSKVPTTRIGRLLKTSAITGAEKMRTGTYEVRNTERYKETAKKLGVPAGKGLATRTKGFEGVREDEVKAQKELAEKQALILAGVDKTKHEEKEKKAKEEADKTKSSLSDAIQHKKNLEKMYGPHPTAAQLAEIADAEKDVLAAHQKNKDKQEELKKTKDEYKEKVTTVLAGTKPAREKIALAETSSKHAVANSTKTALTAERTAVVTKMASALPHERVAMQAKVTELDKKITEQEKIIESAEIAAEKSATTEYTERVSDADAQIQAARTAGTAVAKGTAAGAAARAQLAADIKTQRSEKAEAKLQTEAVDELARAQATGNPALVAAVQARYATELAKHNANAADRLRNAARHKRILNETQGGVAGSLETPTAVFGKEIRDDILRPVIKAAGSAASTVVTLGRYREGLDIGSSSTKEAGKQLREKNQPKP